MCAAHCGTPCLFDLSKNAVLVAVPVAGSWFVSLKDMCLPTVLTNEAAAMLPNTYLN